MFNTSTPHIVCPATWYLKQDNDDIRIYQRITPHRSPNNRYRVAFPRVKRPVRGARHPCHLVPGSRMGRAIPPSALCVCFASYWTANQRTIHSTQPSFFKPLTMASKADISSTENYTAPSCTPEPSCYRCLHKMTVKLRQQERFAPISDLFPLNHESPTRGPPAACGPSVYFIQHSLWSQSNHRMEPGPAPKKFLKPNCFSAKVRRIKTDGYPTM
jgi:hypothetical protein